MKQTLFTVRYWLEMIALPAFVFLSIHLAGHGAMLLFEEEHDHHEHAHGHESFLEKIGEGLFSMESVLGMAFLIIFIWIWSYPTFKKWVPCSHDHCHGEIKISHVLATVALCLHFFPESVVRHELIAEAFEGGAIGMLGLIGFFAHSLVDIVVAIVISSYWKTRKGFILSLVIIVAVWLLAFFVKDAVLTALPERFEGGFYILSAFLLAMFIHKPHKPTKCKKCETH